MKHHEPESAFARAFIDCCYEAQGSLEGLRGAGSPQYTAARRAREQARDALRRELNEDAQPLVNRLDEAICAMFSAEDGFIYQQAFRDCVWLLGWLGVLCPGQSAALPPQAQA